jgi:hypothetical protein
MKQNESTVDRLIRAIVGVVIIYLSYVKLSGTVAIIGYVIGIISVVTALTGFCYLYKVLGISTKKN